MKLNCIIVDDEPLAQDVLETYIGRIEALQLTAKCKNAFEAMNVLHKKKIDIMFLDIKMPTLSGLDMLKTIDNPPKVILTTAFSEFGAESYEYGVSDYLLKPIAFERFLKAVNKILIPAHGAAIPESSTPKQPAPEVIFFKADKKIHKFHHKEILYLEGYGNYVKVHNTQGKPLLVLDKLSNMAGQLPAGQFLRVHKSYIINLEHVSHIEGNRLMLGDTEVPVSGTYKQDLLDTIGRRP